MAPPPRRRLVLLLTAVIAVVAVAHAQEDDVEETRVWAMRLPPSAMTGRSARALRMPRGVSLDMDDALFGDTLIVRLDDGVDADSVAQQLGATWYEQQVARRRFKRSLPSDPLFEKQWHLRNTRNRGRDVYVTGLWDSGVTGAGVTVAMVDDGLQWTHPDIRDRYSSSTSYDFNSRDYDPSPTNPADNHGTRCAGQIVGVRDNGVCGVGVAYDAHISGIRLIAESITDAQEAAALLLHNSVNAIYSNSWGPTDSGAGVDGPGANTRRALETGVESGRDGRGSIFVFASGNGYSRGDDCNFDGYANSPFTIAIGALTEGNVAPSYSEGCAALLAVAYSSGTTSTSGITTIDLADGCTSSHSGTSAAAPLAAGVLALVLSVRPDLTWRDVQHLIVRHATFVDDGNSGWQLNAAGLRVHHRYGFGLIQAAPLVAAARTWKTVGGSAYQQVWTSADLITSGAPLPKGGAGASFVASVASSSSPDEPELAVPDLVEWVVVTVWLAHPRRGKVKFELVSPSGTRLLLAPTRSNDASTSGLDGWSFTSSHFWDEPAEGRWTLVVTDTDSSGSAGGALTRWRLALRGRFADGRPATTAPQTLADYIVAAIVAAVIAVTAAVTAAIVYAKKKCGRRGPMRRGDDGVPIREPDDEDELNVLSEEQEREEEAVAAQQMPIDLSDEESAPAYSEQGEQRRADDEAARQSV